MQRRTVSLPDDVASEIDAFLAGGGAPSASSFFRDAARAYLATRAAEQMAAEAARLDVDEEVALARGSRRAKGRAPWGRLR